MNKFTEFVSVCCKFEIRFFKLGTMNLTQKGIYKYPHFCETVKFKKYLLAKNNEGNVTIFNISLDINDNIILSIFKQISTIMSYRGFNTMSLFEMNDQVYYVDKMVYRKKIHTFLKMTHGIFITNILDPNFNGLNLTHISLDTSFQMTNVTEFNTNINGLFFGYEDGSIYFAESIYNHETNRFDSKIKFFRNENSFSITFLKKENTKNYMLSGTKGGTVSIYCFENVFSNVLKNIKQIQVNYEIEGLCDYFTIPYYSFFFILGKESNRIIRKKIEEEIFYIENQDIPNRRENLFPDHDKMLL